MIPGGGPILGSPALGLTAAAEITGGIANNIAAIATQAAIAELIFAGEATGFGQPAAQQLFGELVTAGVIAQSGETPFQALAGTQEFSAVGASLAAPATQSAAGLAAVYFGIAAHTAVSAAQSGSAVMTFIATAAAVPSTARQAALGQTGTAFAGGIVQAAAPVEQAATGLLIFTGAGASTAVAATTDAAGVLALIGAMAQSGELAAQDIDALLVFAAAVAQTGADGANQAATGALVHTGAIAATQRRARQMLFGINIAGHVGAAAQTSQRSITAASGLLQFSGPAVQMSAAATQIVLAVLPQLLTIERIDATVEFEPSVTSSTQIRSS